MAGVVDNASLLHKSSEREKEDLDMALKQSNQLYMDAIGTLQGMLVILGVRLIQ